MDRPLLLCTDLDRTVIPNGAQAEAPDARARLATLAAEPDVTLVYMTGRDPGRVAEAIEGWGLPVPDWVLADVGTTILQCGAGEWSRLEAWDAAIGRDWAGCPAARIAAALDDVPALRLQASDRQARFKVSFTVDLARPVLALDAEVAGRLSDLGVRSRRVWSVDELAAVRLLDVLPERASKRHAVEYLQRHLGLGLEDTVVAGDSGNDLGILTSGMPAVLVGNARNEIKAEAESAAVRPEQLYIAASSYAAGVLEGVAHHRPQRSMP